MNEELNNIYVDIITGNLHRSLNNQFITEANYTILMKEMDVKNNLILEQKTEILRLDDALQVEKIKKNSGDSEKQSLLIDIKNLSTERDSMLNKISHIETFSKQIREMNITIDDKDKTIDSLNKKINELKEDKDKTIDSLNKKINELKEDIKNIQEKPQLSINVIESPKEIKKTKKK